MDFIWNHLNAIAEPEIKDQAIVNYRRYLRDVTPTVAQSLRSRRVHAIGDAINSAFNWTNSPQRHQYWSEIAHRYGMEF